MNERTGSANENLPDEELRETLRKYVDEHVLDDGAARELYGKLTNLLEADLQKMEEEKP